MRIFGFPSHGTKTRVAGVDFARVIQPVESLQGYKGTKVSVYDPVKDEKHSEPTEWIDIMENHDIMYFNYLNNPWAFAVMGMVARKNGVKIIMDIDDSMWDIHDDNPAYKTYQPGGQAIKDLNSIINEVDHITCTNEYLKNVIISRTNKRPDQITVLPNYIDFNIYHYRPEFKDTEDILITHFGSTTHFKDLDTHPFFMGMDKIMKEYPHVKFRSVGAFLGKFRKKWGLRYENYYGHEDIYTWIKEKYPKYMEETDFFVTPLVDDIYNRCKSPIKWLEASAVKKPGIWQDIRQYREVIDETNGFLAKKDKDWYRAMKELIEDKEKRKAMGEKAFKDVEKGWQMKDHKEDYYQMFKAVIDKK